MDGGEIAICSVVDAVLASTFCGWILSGSLNFVWQSGFCLAVWMLAGCEEVGLETGLGGSHDRNGCMVGKVGPL